MIDSGSGFRLLRRVAGALLCSVLPSLALAQDCERADRLGWAAIKWDQIEYPLSVRMPERRVLDPLFSEITKAARDYYAGAGFPAPSLCVIYPLGVDPTQGAGNAAYYPSTGQIEVRTSSIGTSTDFLNTRDGVTGQRISDYDALVAFLNHELFHAIQQSQTDLVYLANSGYLWVVEGTANAASLAVSRKLADQDMVLILSNWRPDYDLPLHEPEALPVPSDGAALDRIHRSFSIGMGTASELGERLNDDRERRVLGAYTRGHFFHFMGRDIGAADGASWLAKHWTPTVSDGVRGMRWLDRVLASEGKGGLGLYYPQFIATHANDLALYSADARQLAPWDVSLTAGEVATTTRRVLQNAATPVAIDLRIDKVGVYVASQRITTSSDRLHLVVDDQLMPPGAPYQQVITDGTASWLTRIINIHPRAPWMVGAKDATLELAITPLQIGSFCAAPGENFRLTMNAEAETAIAPQLLNGSLRWSLKGGQQIGPLELRAPDKAGTYEIALETRKNGRWQSQGVGKVTVHPNGCSVRAVMGRDGSQTVFTYSAQHDTTEVATDDGARVFMTRDRFAMWTPDTGFVELPPEVGAMMTPQVFPDDADELRVYGDTVEDRMAHLPLMLADLFSRSGAQAVADGAASSESLTRRRAPLSPSRPVTCPDSGSGCEAFTATAFGMATADVIVDDRGRARQVDFAGARFVLSYGDFQIMSPPW